MPRVRFGEPSNSGGYEPLPDGEYFCSIVQIEVMRTRKNDEMWKLRVHVEEGDYSGRCVFDRLVFSDAASGRLEIFCKALGLPTEGEFDLTPTMIKGRSCMVDVVTEDYQDGEGRTRTANKITYEGYHPVPRPAGGGTADADDLPF